MNLNNVEFLFNPRSVAVIGVSTTPEKLGSIIFQNLQSERRKVYPVNPKYPDVFGQKCFDKVANIGTEIDMAVIVVPASLVKDVVADCVSAKVKVAIIISAGFSETGAEGAKLEAEILELARNGNMRLLGPNCLGVVCPATDLNASFAPKGLSNGSVAVLSQSGAFNTALLDLAKVNHLGFKYFVSIGNKSDIDELDLISYFGQDSEVKTIGAYLEEFTDGKDLTDIAIANAAKPIVVLHPGETAAGRTAISTHTGSMAGESVTVAAALHQNGILQVNSLEKMFNLLSLTSRYTAIPGKRVAIVTNAGGPGIMVTDMVVNNGLEMAVLSDDTKQKLQIILPPAGSNHNPIDLLGDALADRYQKSLQVVLSDSNVDIAIALLTPQLVTQVTETAEALLALAQTTTKPLIPIFIGGEMVAPGLSLMQTNGLPAFQFEEEGIAAVAALSKRETSQVSMPLFQLKKQISKVQLVPGEKALDATTVHTLASQFELTVPGEKVTGDVMEAASFAKTIGYPVVMKALSSDLLHKTEFKAVVTNIKDEQQLHVEFKNLTVNVGNAIGKTEGVKLLVQQQIVGGIELFIGAKRDGDAGVYENGKGFGHTLLVGSGGIYTEVYKDIASGIVPMSADQLDKLLATTKIDSILKGARGGQPMARAELLNFLMKVQSLLVTYPEIKELDINPLLVTKDAVYAADIKLIVG